MATQKKEQKQNKKLADKDNPSLCEVGGKIRLRVLEDFNVETELPKWVRFKAEWNKMTESIGISSNCTDVKSVEAAVSRIKGKSEEEKAALLKNAKALVAMNKAIRDDRYDIRGKHEREVDDAILRQAKFVRGLSIWDKLKAWLPFAGKPTPVTVAMDELISHIELTSTEALEARMAKIKEIEANMRKAGQYKKADAVRDYRTIIAEESAIVAAGFTSYVTEEVMIDFVRKSQRGTMVNFLRYYEDQIPQDVVDKKAEVDKLMVFDNYVVAYYSDLIQKAASTEKKVSAAQEKRQRELRRDPILFGVIKNSRKLYYICDWVTDTDDLTLEKLEKELGVTRGSLVDGAETGRIGSNNVAASSLDVDNGDALVTDMRDELTRMTAIAYEAGVRAGRPNGGYGWSLT